MPPARYARAMSRVLALFLSLLLVLAAPQAKAHPHEFIDARLDFLFDEDARLTGFGVEWRYDDLTTMLILIDLGMDPAQTDLSPEEAPDLQAFDLQWIEGYDGDLWPMGDGVPLQMLPPQAGPTRVEGGQIVSRHVRMLAEPVDPRQIPVVVQIYDPEFYTAYTLAQGSDDINGTGCRARIFAAELDTAYARLEAALEEIMQGGGDIESNFPRVGRDFADEIRIDCSGTEAQDPTGG